MWFSMEVELPNDAKDAGSEFCEARTLANALHTLAARLSYEYAAVHPGCGGGIRDDCGTGCGQWRIEDNPQKGTGLSGKVFASAFTLKQTPA